MSEGRTRRDFYEIQKRQKRKSLLVFAALILFYFMAVGLVTLAVMASLGLLAVIPFSWTGASLGKILPADLAVAVLVAAIHYQEARKYGAGRLLKRMGAEPPIASDRYHAQFSNVLEEIRIAAGLPRVHAYVFPSTVINSMALIESDGTPAVAVTEGLLAESTRGELQAVVAHELAHIARGDAFIVTLVCCLAELFEQVKDSCQPDDPQPRHAVRGRNAQGGGFLPVYMAAWLSTLVLRCLSTLISREREILADAAAVEFSRDPCALASIIYKAHVRNSFIGDFSPAYAPLFIVSPDSRFMTESLFSRFFGTHPPLMRRLGILAAMMNKKPEDIIIGIRESDKKREEARIVLNSYEETGSHETAGEPEEKAEEGIWFVRNPEGVWSGPMKMAEMISLPFFTALIPVRNAQEGIEAKAREFPQIRLALRALNGKTPIDPAKKNKCPRCGRPLAEEFYEGVPVKSCRRCKGRFINAGAMERILARKEVDFSKALLEKAAAFKERFLADPVKAKPISETRPSSPLFCPECGFAMKPRPYSYGYFIPVSKCFSCHGIWFDADEMEILQILIENKTGRSSSS